MLVLQLPQQFIVILILLVLLVKHTCLYAFLKHNFFRRILYLNLLEAIFFNVQGFETKFLCFFHDLIWDLPAWHLFSFFSESLFLNFEFLDLLFFFTEILSFKLADLI